MKKSQEASGRIRRLFLKGAAGLGAAQLLPNAWSMDAAEQEAENRRAPAIIASEKLRPQMPYGTMSGDVTQGSAIVWSKTDRPAQMVVELEGVRGEGNRPPSDGLQFFGLADIKEETSVMTVSLRDINGKTLYSVDLEPQLS